MSTHDLLGPHAAVKHYQQDTTPPRQKRAPKPHPAPLLVASDYADYQASAARIAAEKAREFQVWALEELERWRDRLPPAEYARQKAKLEADAS